MKERHGDSGYGNAHYGVKKNGENSLKNVFEDEFENDFHAHVM